MSLTIRADSDAICKNVGFRMQKYSCVIDLIVCDAAHESDISDKISIEEN